MEYLMTYGWAILIISIVLAALFSLGVFNSSSFLGTSCIAQSGFYCSNPVLSTAGTLNITVGQATGTTFPNTYVYFVPSGTNFSSSDPGADIGTLNSGQQVNVDIPLEVGSPYPTSYTLGTPLSGELYMQYTDAYGTTIQNEIGTVTTKVTATSSSGVTLSQPSALPSGITAYVQVALQNSQTTATPSPFQQMIQINEGTYANYITYNGVVANFEFFTQSGQVLPAWIESNNSGTLTVWVNLPNGIPASSSLAIYLGFASKTTNLLSSSGTSGIGEAPQLSPTYAEYDDGASVFNFYDNFAGTTLSSKWVSGTSGGSYTINNGLTITLPYNAATGNYVYISTSSYTITSAQIVESDANLNGFDTTNFRMVPVALTQYNNVAWHADNGENENGVGWSGDSQGRAQVSAVATTSSAINDFETSVINSESAYELWGIIYPNTGDVSVQYNYNNWGSTTTYVPATPLYIAMSNYVNPSQNIISTTYPINVYYIRARAYPPNGVMPSVSFGGLSTA